ncbi:MAG TPA: NAD(+)/NADH kinase [Candidatus Acidoferrales bacterium]|nr:NAD(+)/NADH kinase [Candidatus Acidoferrales bacterium]
MIRSVGIFAKPQKEKIGAMLPELVRWLRARKVEVYCERFAAEFAGGDVAALSPEELPGRVELLVVLGGDGTLLAAAQAASEHDVPILPVNFGQLGFLTSVALDELYPTLDEALAGDFQTGAHMMLEAEVARGGQTLGKRRGLNDAVLTKGLPAHMIDFELFVDDVFVSEFRADGIIFSTPTGSTAYSLSAGGPILSHQLEAFVVTPVCPHMLTNRPLVLPHTARLAARFTGGEQPAYLTVDGQIALELQHGDAVRVRRAERQLRLVLPPQRSYFEVLRSKLRWGDQ